MNGLRNRIMEGKNMPTKPSSLAALLARSAPDQGPGHAGKDPGRVAEIATFSLAPGVTDQDFTVAAKETFAMLSGLPGCLGRSLSKGANNRWTDHVLWTDMATAEAAAQAIMASPLAAPFMAAIDMQTLTMRHETIFLQA
jgi:hypothetical protein